MSRTTRRIRDLRIGFIHQPAHLMGEVLHRAPLGQPPARQRLKAIARALPPVLSPAAPAGAAEGADNNWVDFVKADHRPLGVIGFGVQVQHVLHVGHEVGAYLWDAPFLLLPRLEDVFLSRWRTVHGTGRAPTPTPPPCPPTGARSSGHAPPALGCRPGQSGGLRPGRPASGTAGPGAGPAKPLPAQPRRSAA